MRAIPIAVAVVLIGSAPVRAAWDVSSVRDPMTDRTTSVATVTSGDVLLRVRCVNGKPFPDVLFPGIVGFGELGITHRIDSAAAVPRIAPVSQDGRAVYLLESVPALTKAHRLRVEAAGAFLDFDLTGGAAALGAVCGR